MKGRFIKGHHYSPKTEFKKGQTRHKPKPYWNRDWLWNEYIIKNKSAQDIAKEMNCTDNNILFWIHKFDIPTRSISETRKVKRWGSFGEKNPMYGKRGILNPHWKGGLTPYRLSIYSSKEWKKLARDLYKRDKVCRLCGEREKLQIHHIEPLSQSPLLILDIGNVILLCQKCHWKLQGKERRWRNKLLKLVRENVKP